MQKIFATLAILTLAACGSAAQTGPRTTNPPLIDAQKPKPAPPTDAPPPSEGATTDVSGATLTLRGIDFQLTMTKAPWQVWNAQSGGSRIFFVRQDVPATMMIIAVKKAGTDAKGMTEEAEKQAKAGGLTIVQPTAAESPTRWAFVADGLEGGNPARTYAAVVQHPTTKDAYLVFIAACDPKNADAFFKDVRAVADSVSPIK